MVSLKRKEKKPIPEIDQALAQKLYVKNKRRKKRHIICAIIFALLIVTCIVAYRVIKPVYVSTANTVYDVLDNMTDANFIHQGNTVIYDKDNQIIGQIGSEKFQYVDINDISDYITNGYIAKEDKNFKTHMGIDPKAILRAGIAYIKNRGHVTQGGSTITQQVIKNNLLSQERTFSRKITELFLAVQLEKTYTKSDIMEFYCNSNYYGNGCYGVEAACQYYFGKSAKDVTLGEAAIIVATSNLPNKYNPVVDYDLSIQKRNSVLEKMLEDGYISQYQYDEACKEQPEIVQKVPESAKNVYLSSYAIYCSALKLMQEDGFEFKYVFQSSEEEEQYNSNYNEAYAKAVEEIRTGGYKIYTSLDLNIQNQLQESIDNGLAEFTDKSEEDIYTMQSGAVCIDNRTQMVVAIVGGRSGSGEFNRGYQAKRQPGSAIKPILDYGPGINEGYISPGKIIKDEPVSFNGYEPENYSLSYQGNISVRKALIESVNTVAVKVFDKVGINTAVSYLNNLHFTSLTYADTTLYPIALGGFTNGLTVADMARAYATIENGGEYSDNDCILTIKAYSNDVIYQASTETTSVYNEDTAFMLTDMMNGLFEESYGFAHNASESGQHYAGKTGTTNDQKDAWFCGYSPYYTTSIWVGYDQPAPLGFSGSDYPQSIWVDFMDKIHTDLVPVLFSCPNTIKQANKEKSSILDVSYSGYNSTEQGYDYISGILLNKAEEIKNTEENESIYNEAEAAVRAFEDYSITDIDSAKKLSETYTSAYNQANKVNDQEKRSALLKRLAYKYELLSGDVLTTWNSAIASEEQAEQDKRDAANAILAQENLEAGVEKEKQTKIELVNYYVDELNSYTIYSSNIDVICQRAQNALAQCNEYEEYNSLYQQVTSAVNRAMNLPSGGLQNEGSNSQSNNNNNGSNNGNSTPSAPSNPNTNNRVTISSPEN